jgi:signal transduction histidine kinase
MFFIFCEQSWLLMRKFFSLLFECLISISLILLQSNECLSQFDSSQNIFCLNKLSRQGSLLDKGWRFHSGDNPDYAKPEYDDSKWQSIMGRVLLNLFNNAFYGVTEKKKQAGENYEPTVSVTTKKSEGKVSISVKDNGIGISQKVVNKIFQPFFTTKPTGQGTGLGLSLSYDIIKAHGGEIKVESKEGEGAEFIIQLPI